MTDNNFIKKIGNALNNLTPEGKQKLNERIDELQKEREKELEKEWGLRLRYENYLTWADDGEGGDNTRNGEPLLTFEEWLEK